MHGDAIFGTWGSFDGAAIQAMSQRLQHRGRYDAIRPAAPTATFGWRGALGKTLPSAPLVCACSLLNRDELAALAGLSDAPELDDAELLWELYRARGPQGFAHINGQFALALLDAASGTLLLAVDNWASRPLYYTRCSEGVAFASEYKALLALRTVSRELSPSSIAFLVATKYLPTGEGLFAKIRPVAPGTFVQVGVHGSSATPLSSIKLEPAFDLTAEQHVSRLREALLSACGRLVRDLDAVGIALSGGLDSTLTVGAVRSVKPDTTIYTYTVSFRPDDPVLDLARATADELKTIHREIIISPEELPRLIPRLIWMMEDPVAREEMLVYLAVAEAAAGMVPLVLHGNLSDMLFAGMPRHLLAHLAARTPVFRKALLELFDYSQTGATPESVLGAILERAYYHGQPTPPPRVIGVSDLETAKKLRLARFQPLNTLIFEALGHPTELASLERLHAGYNLGYGSIFHDLDVARCAFRIPESLKIHRLTRKYVLRRAAEGILPKTLTSRPKDMTRMPRQPLRAMFDSMARDLLTPESVRRRGLFQPEDVAALLRPDDRSWAADDHFYHLWTVILMEYWARTFVDRRGAQPIVIEPIADGDRGFAWPSSPPLQKGAVAGEAQRF